MKVLAITINTFREAIKDRILYSLLFFALLMIASSVLLSMLAIGDQAPKIIKDVGLAAISIFGLLIAIFMGIQLVYKEIDKKTIYTIISKPITRYEFLLGKYFGLVLTLIVEVAVMTVSYMFIVWVYVGYLDLVLLKAVLLIFFELMIITAVALMFSTFSTPTLSGLFTLGIYVIGHLSSDLKVFGGESERAVVRYISNFLYYLLPNLSNFNIKGQVVHNIPVSGESILLSTAYGVLYIAMLLFISTIIFNRKDFK